MMNRLFQSLVVLTVVVGVTTVVANPAHAAYSNCPLGNVCIWDGLNGSGSPMYVHSGAPGTCINLPSSVNNRAESFYNHLSGLNRAVQFYDGSGCTGTLLRRQSNGSGGPHFSGAADNFYLDHFLNHRNRATSIFYNSCTGAGCSTVASGTDVGGL